MEMAMNSRIRKVTMGAREMAGLQKTTILNCQQIWKQVCRKLLVEAKKTDTLQLQLGELLLLNNGPTTPLFLWTMCWRVTWSLRVDFFMTTLSRASTRLSGLPSTPSLPHYPLSNWRDATPKTSLPAIGLKLSDLVTRLQSAYQLTTSGKFGEATDRFRSILLSIPLLAVETKAEEQEAAQLKEICCNYLVGLMMESARKEAPKATVADQKRVCEMAAYFTHCNLQPVHQVLTR